MAGRLTVAREIYLQTPALAVALSPDGQYAAVGTETGLAVYNLAGEQLLVYPPPARPMPIHQLVFQAELNRLYAATRPGWVVALDLEREPAAWRYQPQPLYEAPNDVHTLSLSADEQTLAVGHLSPALSVLGADGQLRWRQHPADGTATEGQTWSVAVAEAGDTLFVASAGSGVNRLLALDAQTGSRRAGCYLAPGQVAARLAALPSGQGVAVVSVNDLYSTTLTALDAGLQARHWELTFDEPVTALAADRQLPVLVASVGFEGRLILLEALTGRLLATQTVRTQVNGLALAQGQVVAAATEDGHLVLLRYVAEAGRL